LPSQLALLVLLSPVLVTLAAAVKLTSRGPVLYGQERMGLDGQRFRMMKLRTMGMDAERETGPVWAAAGDDRRTPIGSFLRRFSLDELPQFVNVLRGEMSVVGPRPERPVFVERFRQTVPGYMLRHKVKSGVTGWAQVQRAARQYLPREAHRVRHRVHRALVILARPQDHRHDALQGALRPERLLR